MLKLTCIYFNVILDTGIVPESWTIGLLVPIFKKKGNINDPDNYRGITLLSCLGKLFTMVINDRLKFYLEDNKMLGEEQAGFREGYSTLDHIFSLHCILQLAASQKQRLYCAFVDYRKAFDSVNRSSLWLKLVKHNIKGKVLTVVQNLYKAAKSCVRHNGKISEYFSCNIGVRQGENLSPLLFAIYLNDLESHFAGKCQGIPLKNDNSEYDVLLKLYTLLYADDTILLSESVKDLQDMLDVLFLYCQKWQLTVNIAKTKAVVFSKGKVRNLPSLTYGKEHLEVQYAYTYLGIVIYYNGLFTKAIQTQIAQAKRALFSLLSKARKLQLLLDIQCHLFDSCIVPILLYGCEVWGFSNITKLERVQTYFCKYVLQLSPKTANCVVLGELGRSRLKCIIKQRMINFWCRLATGKSSKISHVLFQIIKDKQATGSLDSPWWTAITKSLNECGMGYILDIPSENLNTVHTKAIVKQRITAIESQEWHSEVMDSGHCTNYRIFKNSLQFETYLTTLTYKQATNLCRFRCGNNKLPIVVGRFNGTARTERYCELCCTNSIGDEFHYIFQCKTFEKDRSIYINAKFSKHPNTLAMEKLFSSKDHLTLSNLAKFCCIIMGKFGNTTPPPLKKRNRNKTKGTCDLQKDGETSQKKSAT